MCSWDITFPRIGHIQMVQPDLMLQTTAVSSAEAKKNGIQSISQSRDSRFMLKVTSVEAETVQVYGKVCILTRNYQIHHNSRTSSPSFWRNGSSQRTRESLSNNVVKGKLSGFSRLNFSVYTLTETEALRLCVCVCSCLIGGQLPSRTPVIQPGKFHVHPICTSAPNVSQLTPSIRTSRTSGA